MKCSAGKLLLPFQEVWLLRTVTVTYLLAQALLISLQLFLLVIETGRQVCAVHCMSYNATISQVLSSSWDLCMFLGSGILMSFMILLYMLSWNTATVSHPDGKTMC